MDLQEYKAIRHYEANTKGRDFIVGDLHGIFSFFNRALSYLQFDSAVDRVFSVGDLVDRGPENVDTALLIEQEWFHCVRGNHEQMMIDATIGTADESLWVMNGGRWAYQELDRVERAAIAKKFDNLPYIITVGEGAERFNICHAEMTFAPDITDEMIDNYVVRDGEAEGTVIAWGEPLIWGRDIVQGHPAPHTAEMSLTYVGHTPINNEPLIIGRQMYIDGGAVFGQKLFIAEHKAKVVHIFTGNLYSSLPFAQVTVMQDR